MVPGAKAAAIGVRHRSAHSCASRTVSSVPRPVAHDDRLATGTGDPVSAAVLVDLVRSSVTEDSWQKALSLCTTPLGTLWCIEGMSGDAGVALGAALGAEIVGEEFAGVDVVTARPGEDRWSVAELDDLVIAPALRPPMGTGRRVVVVGYGETLGKQGADRLLKSLEEPPPSTLFLLCATDAGELPAAILGRAIHRMRLEPEHRDRSFIAAASNLDPDLVHEVRELCGTLLMLAAGVLAHPEHLEALHTAMDGGGDLTRPLTTAAEVAAAVDVLAGLVPGNDKAAKREVTLQLVARAEARARARLRAASTSREFRASVAAMSAFERARSQVKVYVAPADVLAGLFSRLALAAGTAR